MIKWHNYPREIPKSEDMYWCKLDDGEPKRLAWDYVYGWCADWDEMDYPHFIYDFDCQWAEINSKDKREWDKIVEEWKSKRYSNWMDDADWSFIDDDDEDDDDWLWG